MSLSLVQSPTPFSNTGAPLTSLAQAFGSNTTSGNFLLCSVILQAAVNNTDTVAFADTLGNSYQHLTSQPFSSGTCLLQVFYVPSCKVGPNTVTATITGGISTGGIIFIREWSTVGAIDVQSFGTGTSGSIDSGNVTTTKPIELVYGIAGIDILVGSIVSLSNGAGYTLIASSVGSLTVPAYLEEYQITAATGTFSANGSITPAKSTSIAWGSQIVTFAQASLSSSEPRIHVQNGRSGYGPHRNWQGPVG